MKLSKICSTCRLRYKELRQKRHNNKALRHQKRLFTPTVALLTGLFKTVAAFSLIYLSLTPSITEAKDGYSVQSADSHWLRPARAVKTGLAEPQPAANLKQLYPKACSACHPEKYSNWSNSLHSKSFGPGLKTQLSPFDDPSFATSCYNCHAPLIEQSEVLLDGNGYIVNPSFDKELQKRGLSCVVCHQRDSIIYGPNTPGNSHPAPVQSTGGVHATEKNRLFSSAKFCAACHQLDAGYALNGRVLTNTYNEWKESRYAKEGITCQKCHMPNKQHLWRGIHDPKMVLSGLDIQSVLKKQSKDKTFSASLTVVNSGVGHMFPTYITPNVTVAGYLQDSSGNVIKGSRQSEVIARRIALDLSAELFDTRIPPDGKFTFVYRADQTLKRKKAAKLVLEITVSPDEFYNRFFASMLKNAENGSAEYKATGKYKELQAAYKATVESEYLLYRKVFVLTD